MPWGKGENETMKKYLDTGIKEILKEYPNLIPLLESYNMKCVQCKGNCRLKNVFQAENLSMKEEIKLKTQLKDYLK
jgi:hypothetical protein